MAKVTRKASHSRPQALALLLAATSACASVGSERNALGTYEMSSGRNRITLRVCADHLFFEEIGIPGKPTYRHKGRWEWRHGYVDFDDLWVPREFTPRSMIAADAEAPHGFPHITEPRENTLGAEIRFGRRILEVFPDSGPNFTMTDSYSDNRREPKCDVP